MIWEGGDNFIHQDMNYKSKIYMGSKNNVTPLTDLIFLLEK